MKKMWVKREMEKSKRASLVPIFNALLNKTKVLKAKKFSWLSLWIFKTDKMENWNENNSEKRVFLRNKNLLFLLKILYKLRTKAYIMSKSEKS